MKKIPALICKGIVLIASLACGGLIGIVIVNGIGRGRIQNMGIGQYYLTFFAYFAVAILAYFVQIIIHEAGHLVFGLLTGYEFISFRVGSLTWVKMDGRIERKRFKLAGTAGQCLMAPPDLADGKMPVVLYNLGGALMNIIAAALFFPLYRLCREIPVLNVFLGSLCVTGILTAIQNGVPAKLKKLPNDGYNIVSLLSDSDAVRAFWTQMKVNEKGTEGVRLRSMPEGWFGLKDGADMDNPLISAVALLDESRRLDMHEFEDAYARAERILNGNFDLPVLYRSMVTCDYIYTGLVTGRGLDKSAWEQKDFAMFRRQMGKNPSVIRTLYAAELLGNNDSAAAEKQSELFKKTAESYPTPADIEMERELIEIARSLSE